MADQGKGDRPAPGKAAAARDTSAAAPAKATRGTGAEIDVDADLDKNAVQELLAPIAGFGVTISTLFKPVVTEQYPFEKKPTAPRYHGRHQLNRYPDGLEKCIGCELCAWACPADAIYVEAGNNAPDAQYSPGERFGIVYQINYLRCIFCGLCIEACPTRALTMTNDYELAGQTRAGMIYEKDELLAPLRSGMLEAPHPMVAGTSDVDYYNGDVTGPTSEQVEWVEAHRPDDPTISSAAGAAKRAGAGAAKGAR